MAISTARGCLLTATALCLTTTLAVADEVVVIQRLAQLYKDAGIISAYRTDESAALLDLIQAPPPQGKPGFEKTLAAQAARVFCAKATTDFSPWDKVWTVRVFLPNDPTPVASCRFPVLPGQLKR
jgi:hypothetical protein